MKLIIINTGICTTTIKGKEYFQVGLTVRNRETEKERYYDNMYLSEYKMGHTAY